MSSNKIVWFQNSIHISRKRGCHLITSDVEKSISNQLKKIKIGMCNVFCLLFNFFIQKELFYFIILYFKLKKIILIQN